MMNIGVIGAGAFSRYTLEAYKQYLDGVQVTAITSRTLDKAEALAKSIGIPEVKPDNSSLLSDPDIDIVLILTPPLTHYDLVVEALANGKHVLVDKPVVFTEEQVLDISERAERAGLHLSTNLVLRAHRFNQRIREINQSGSMGALLQIITSAMLARYPDDHWYWKPEISGGFFLNTFSHFLDLYDFIIGAEPTPLHATGNPDHGYFLSGSYPSGTLTTLAVSLQVSNPNERVHTSYIFEKGVVETQGWLPETLSICPEDGPDEDLVSPSKDDDYKQCLATIMNDFVARASGLGQQASTGIDLDVIRGSVTIPLQFSKLADKGD